MTFGDWDVIENDKKHVKCNVCQKVTHYYNMARHRLQHSESYKLEKKKVMDTRREIHLKEKQLKALQKVGTPKRVNLEKRVLRLNRLIEDFCDDSEKQQKLIDLRNAMP
jgi:hypothetical protein